LKGGAIGESKEKGKWRERVELANQIKTKYKYYGKGWL